MISKLIQLAEDGLLPDFLIRAGIVRNCKVRLQNESSSSLEQLKERKLKWVDQMKESPIALVPEKANQQHYEVPPSFFDEVLGSNLKYSSGFWPQTVTTLDESELAMLELSCERAELENGQNICMQFKQVENN